MTNSRQPGNQDTVATIRAVWEYLKSLQGTASALPTAVAVVDAWADLLGISSAIKPLVYILAICFVAYVFLSEVSRYIQTTTGSADFDKMGKRAARHFIIFLGSCGVYWIGISYLELNPTDQLWLEQAVLFLFASAAALAFAEITRALAIHGLRIYISTYRSP